jgi:hypothetical protein
VSSSRWKLPLLLFAGSLLLQSAWILSLPPFRGSDEVDHAYRAAAVARGEWNPQKVAAEHGRGDLVTVPGGLVTAARPACQELPYMGRDNCHPVTTRDNGMVQVASASASYNPAFYWVVGTAARPFDGTNALYAMRICGALLCAALIALAGWSVGLWSRSLWPMASLFVALTPVTMYSTTVVAPNGIELAAAAALWCSLLGLCTPTLHPRIERALLWATLPSATVLATVRTLGPLWLALIVVTCVGLVGVEQVKGLVRRHKGLLSALITTITAFTLISVLWIVTVKPNQSENEARVDDPIINALRQVLLWFLQSIAAFPFRDQQAPTIVYAAWTLPLIGLVAAGIRLGQSRLRGALFWSMGMSLAVPVAVTIAYSNTDSGDVWQGRYGLPFTMGVMLIAGLALERRTPKHLLITPLVGISAFALMVAHVVGVTNVLRDEHRSFPLAGGTGWLEPSPLLVVLLVIAGWTAWCGSIVWLREHNPPDTPNSTKSASVPTMETSVG